MNRSDREILASLMNAQAIELSAAGAVALARELCGSLVLFGNLLGPLLGGLRSC